jgi:hypothetical protein
MSVLTRYQNLRSKYRTAGSRLREEQGAYQNLLKQQKELQESTYGKGSDSLQSKYDAAVAAYGTTQAEMTGSQGYKDWQTAKSTYETARTSAFGTTGTGGEFGEIQAKIDARREYIGDVQAFDRTKQSRLRTKDYVSMVTPQRGRSAVRMDVRGTPNTGITEFDDFLDARETWRTEQVYHRSFQWLSDSQQDLLNTYYDRDYVGGLQDWAMTLEMRDDISDYGAFEDIRFQYGAKDPISQFVGLSYGNPKLYEKLGGKDFTDQLAKQTERYGKASKAFYGEDGEGGAVGAYMAWSNQPSSWQTDQQNLATKYGLEEKQAAVTSAYEGEEYKGYRTKLAQLTSDAEGYQREIKGPGGADSKLAQIQTDIKASQGRIRQYGGDQALLAMTMPGAFAQLSFAQETRKRGTRESAFRTTTLTSRSPYRF